MRVLVSGFEPFGGEAVNPSARVVEGLAADGVDGLVLPVVFAEAWPRLAAAIDGADPDIVLALGQAGGSSAVTVEQIAVNLDGPGSPDEAGELPEDAPIIDGEPLAYQARLPVRRLVDELRSAGIPARRSRSAGGHLCNHVFYRLCHLAETERPHLLTGFVHLPYLPEQTLERQQPSMALDVQVAAVGRILDALRAAR